MTTSVPIPAASVILVRDGSPGLEVLMVRRNEGIAFHGGSWVFPGGKVDTADVLAGDREHVDTARRTAVREAWEEAGLRLTADELRPFSHWTTSTARPKRFSTWFFLAALDRGAEVRVDGGEIVDARWLSAADAIEARRRGEIVLPPATFVTLTMLGGLAGVGDMPAYFERHVVERFNPKIVKVPDGEVALYEGDTGYDALTLEGAGARHRLHMLSSTWRYERTAWSILR